MSIDCSSDQPAKWGDLAALGARVDEEYAPYTHTEFRTLSGKYIWLFDPYSEDACNGVADHWMEPDDGFTLNEAEQAMYDEDALLFLGVDEDNAQANDCFCCGLAKVIGASPLQFGMPDAGVGGSCFNGLNFENPCGDNSEGVGRVLNTAVLDFFSAVGNRKKRHRANEVLVDGERLLFYEMPLCEDADQTMRIGLLWMTEDDFPDWDPPPGVTGTYVLRRIEIDLSGKLVFQIRAADMARLRDKVEDYLDERCAATDDRWMDKDGEFINEGCSLTLPEVVCTLRDENELEENAGCLDCDDTGDELEILEPWTELTCGAENACSDKIPLYCETLKQWEVLLDELDGDDIKEDDGTTDTGCQVCCGGIRQDGLLEMIFHFDHGCQCAKFTVYYTPCSDADGEDCDEEQTFGPIDMNGNGDIYDSVTGWKEVNVFRRQYIKFRFECNSNCTTGNGGWDGCHEGASAKFRVDGVEVSGVGLTVQTSGDPQIIDVCALFDPAP